MKRFLKRQIAVLLAVLMVVSMIPAASAATPDITKTVESGESASFSRATFKNLYDQDSSVDSEFSYLVFTDYEGLDDYGYLTAYNRSGNEAVIRQNSLKNMWFYYDAKDIAYDSDCSLAGLTFVADDDAASGSFTLEFTLQGEKSGDKVTGTIKITVDGSNAAVDGDIVYQVEPGEEVQFSAEDFFNYFDTNYPSAFYDLNYVEFFRPEEAALEHGALYYNYGKSSEEAFGRTSFANTTFYYSDGEYGDYPLDKLYFVADSTFKEDVVLEFRAYYSAARYVDGAVTLTTNAVVASDADITFSTSEENEVVLDRNDFKDFFEDYYDDFYYLEFTEVEGLDDIGSITARAYDEDERTFEEEILDERDLLTSYFYYYDSDARADAGKGYAMDEMTFTADKNTNGKSVVLSFTAYGADTDERIRGAVTIEVDEDGVVKTEGVMKHTVEKGTVLDFDSEDFVDYFQETYEDYNLKYVRFTASENLSSYNGYMYIDYEGEDENRLTASELEEYTFYCKWSDVPTDSDNAYLLDYLSFVASNYFDEEVTLNFRAYYNSSRYVDGTVSIKPKDAASTDTPAVSDGSVSADIIYMTAYNSSVRINANDFARFLQSKYPTSTLESVKINGVPGTGGVYYNYYSTSRYGTTARVKLTAANCDDQNFYFSPSGTSQYALSELTYVPSGTNYCAAIPFTAYGSGSKSASGIVYISVSTKTVPEIYGLINRNVAVSFPAPSIAAAVATATSEGLAGIQLLQLPESSKGTVYVGSGTSRKATATDVYQYSGDGWTISQLRFVPASGYTGSVEIPYAAVDASGKAIAVGKFCLGVVTSSAKKFTDVTSSTWCYKYVMELTDAGVISGYTDGTFKPGNQISYGAALKLIMLAAGYSEQTPTDSNVFSGYLAKARADGIITRTNVDLSAPITRLQVAQLAAGAMKLDLDNLPSINPFTDTTDRSVQALNAAGIVEGYYTNGVNTYNPSGTLTRGAVSAIVWRMQNYLD